LHPGYQDTGNPLVPYADAGMPASIMVSVNINFPKFDRIVPTQSMETIIGSCC